MVFQSVSGGAWSPVMGTAESPLSASSALVRGLDNGVSYAFAVASVDAALNVSERSAAVEATPEDPDAGPALVGFSPTSGDVVGGELVEIVGTGLGAVDEVRFDDQAATLVETSRHRLVVRTPAHVVGGAEVRLLVADATVQRAADPFTFVRRELESVDVAVARPDTVMLTPDDVYAVASVATGAIDITLADGGAVGGVVRGAGVYLEPGHPDASTGLAGTVQSLDEVDGRTVVTVERAPVDQVLAERDFARSVSFGTVARRSGSAATAAGSAQDIYSVNRSFLDCRRVVQHEDGSYETLESLPADQVDVKVKFTIADLRADVIEDGTGSAHRYAASISGDPTLQIVARAEVSAKCEFLPSLTDKLALQLPVGPLELKIKPDLAVTFRVSGKAIITKKSSFVVRSAQERRPGDRVLPRLHPVAGHHLRHRRGRHPDPGRRRLQPPVSGGRRSLRQAGTGRRPLVRVPSGLGQPLPDPGS